MQQGLDEEDRKTTHDLYVKRGMEHSRDLEDLLTTETVVNEQHAGNGTDEGDGKKK